jgi:hypothetical protein
MSNHDSYYEKELLYNTKRLRYLIRDLNIFLLDFALSFLFCILLASVIPVSPHTHNSNTKICPIYKQFINSLLSKVLIPLSFHELQLSI